MGTLFTLRCTSDVSPKSIYGAFGLKKIHFLLMQLYIEYVLLSIEIASRIGCFAKKYYIYLLGRIPAL